VHYPLPLNPVETGAFLMDKETMKRMVHRMSQTLSEFKNMNSTLNSAVGSNFGGRQTAREFFSKDNLIHPVVEENQKLREKLRMLQEVSSQKSGSAQMHQMSSEADRVAQNFENYKINSNQELKKLRTLK
jgi:hypothetical protein